jgi:hypothetical protein
MFSGLGESSGSLGSRFNDTHPIPPVNTKKTKIFYFIRFNYGKRKIRMEIARNKLEKFYEYKKEGWTQSQFDTFIGILEVHLQGDNKQAAMLNFRIECQELFEDENLTSKEKDKLLEEKKRKLIALYPELSE